MMLKNNFLIDTIANLTSRRWKLITSICSDNCILCFTCFFHKVALYNKYNTKTGIDHMKSADIPPVLFLWTWSYYPSLHSYSAPCIMLICHGSQPGNIIIITITASITMFKIYEYVTTEDDFIDWSITCNISKHRTQFFILEGENSNYPCGKYIISYWASQS